MLLENIDILRFEAYHKLDLRRRAKLGQFSTSSSIAKLMASMFTKRFQSIKLLDAGAGIGSLSAAFIERTCNSQHKPESLSVTAYEIEPKLIDYLYSTFDICNESCKCRGIKFNLKVHNDDFIEAAVEIIGKNLGKNNRGCFNCAILNPPYRKIHAKSKERHLLKRIGAETNNLYAAFLWLTIELLEPGGEIVAIIPRSFCNGPYFKAFRNAFFKTMTLNRIHLFESRVEAFHEDDVLQEIIIIHATKSFDKSCKVFISSSIGPEDECITRMEIDHNQLVHPEDPYAILHIISDENAHLVGKQMQKLDSSLEELDLSVSTGRVVDFRAQKKHLLSNDLTERTVPLIYPANIIDGFVNWPVRGFRKPNAIISTRETHHLLVPTGFYVLVKRFSSKEEPKRIVAAVYDPNRVPACMVGFENHLNYFHQQGKGIQPELAKGLAAFLNSTYVDQYFRQFSGHTQVNVADLKSLKYPCKEKLISLGTKIDGMSPPQKDLDRLVNNEINIINNDKN